PIHVNVVGERITLEDLSLSTHGGELHARGTMDGRKLNASVKGHLDLELAQPFVRAFAEKLTGDLEVAVEAAGTLDKPDVRGRLDNPVVTAWLGLGAVTFRLRDTGTLVEVQSGVVEVTNSGALLRDVRVVIDEQGRLVIGAAGVRPGQLEIKRLVPFQ